MKVAIVGGTGLLGSRLVRELSSGNHDPVVLSRRVDASRKTTTIAPVRKWDPNGDVAANIQALDAVDAIVNLAGEPIDSGRWTAARKQRIRESRIQSVRSILEALTQMVNKPPVLISGSAVGIYGSKGDKILAEDEEPGTDFLAEVCRDLESEIANAKKFGLRVVVIRTGVVLSSSGGALSKMLPHFKLGLGGRIGRGRQWFPWVHEDDVAGIISHCLENDSIKGAVNAASPGIVTNRGFTKALGKVLGRPTLFPVPILALRMVFGEMSSILYSSHRTSAEKIQKLGYSFKYPEIEGALRDCTLKRET